MFYSARGLRKRGYTIAKNYVTPERRKYTRIDQHEFIGFHDCRHTAATIMLSHGIPPVIVAGMLGHSLSILMDTYTHFIPTMQGEAAQLMSDLFTPIPIDLRDLKREKS